ncbi:MAG: CDP-diacylglycerol--serine O-phosphatidyltransferase [Deltaproteobacteria bacterium]|nr:CDP-diacylglycerol--serine O-phosphatidyltransferase [Deltaproteobacteria bacterium]
MSGAPRESWSQVSAEGRRRRRRRPRGERRRGLHLLPNLFTTGNLFFGFYTIVHATLGDADHAALGIVLAMAFDIFDGRVARLANATSKFGGEYDSLADVVSFGVAPAILAFSAGDLRILGRAGWVLAFLYVVCAALRLARFNVSPSRYKGRFEGLPSPAAAGMIASTQWFVDFVETSQPWSAPPWLVAIGTGAVGLMMVSTIPYRSFKEIDLRHSYGTLVLLVCAITLLVIEPSVTLFAVFLAYLLSGPVEWAWRRAKRRPLPMTEPLANPEHVEEAP